MMWGRQDRELLISTRDRTSTVRDMARRVSDDMERILEDSLRVGADGSENAEAISGISDNLSMISAAAEQFSVNLQHIRASTRGSRDDIDAIHRTTTELATASTDIANNTERARTVSQEAVRQVEATLTQVTGLEDIAAEISNVTQLIHDISEQTKVLAFNATIEAARESEAGRGFAVVAREVKALATETREATDFIRARVSAITDSIGATISAIKQVSGVIGDVNEVVNNIAAAAEQQSIGTRRIAEHSGSAAGHFEQITTAIEEGSTAMNDVTARLASAAQQTREAAQASDRIASGSRQIGTEATVSFAEIMECCERLDEIDAQLQTAKLPAASSPTEQPTMLFNYTDRFSVLVDDMDQDHQRIFAFINQIHRLIKEQASHGKQLSVLQEMAAFTRSHFEREEALMQQHAYPGFAKQQQAHQKLLETVAGYIQTLEAGRPVNLIAALKFLNDWLKEHILVMDRQYGDYFKRKRISA